MQFGSIIETIGTITKMENICSLEEHIHRDTLVLRNMDPFPGFIPKRESGFCQIKPGSVFIILRYRYSPEKINRINKDLIASRITTCIPSYGEIITRDSILPCIRLKGLVDYSLITAIQSFFQRNEIQLMNYRKIESTARIKIFKTFRLIEIADGLYRDLNEGAKIYIRLNQSLNWKQFNEITKKIKFDRASRNFDAALGIIYRFCGSEDVIRIYDQDKTLERALLLKKLYLKEVKRTTMISAHHDELNG
jgi:hypothetical protein